MDRESSPEDGEILEEGELEPGDGHNDSIAGQVSEPE